MSHLVIARKRSLLPGAGALLALILFVVAWVGSAAAQGTGTITITKETNLPGGTDFSFWKVDYLTKWGSFGTGNGQFSGITDLAVDGSGNVFVLDTNINTSTYRVQKFSSTGAYLTQWGTQGSGPGQFNSPNGIAVDAAGNVYVADTGNHRIQKFDGAGTFLAQWGTQGGGDGQFQYPMDVALDGTGNIYVADFNNYRIQKFDSTGAFIAKWGAQGSGDGQFEGLDSIVVDGTGNVYVSESYPNHRVQKFDSAGVFVAVVGGPGGADGEFDYPYGLAVDGSDNVYVADSSHNRIQVFDSAGEFVAKWGSSGTGDGQISGPIGVAVDASGNVFVGEWSNSRIHKFGPTAGVSLDDGQSHTWEDLSPGTYLIGERLPDGWGLSNLVCDGGSPDENQNDVTLTLAAGEDVECVFSNVGTAQVTITKDTIPAGAQYFSFTLSPGPVAPSGKYGSQGSASGLFNFPTDVAIDGAGNIYVADQSNHRIQKFDNNGTYLTQWGIQGVTAGRFNYPQGVAVDGSGNVYVADTVNHRVQKFDSNGAFLMAWGWDVVVGGGTGFEVCTPTDTCKAAANGSGDGQFIFPNRLVVDGSGNVYVVDATRRVQKFNAATGAFILKWGSIGSGDNQFGQAAGIAVDAAGNVYVADQTNDRIQKFDSDGTFLAKWGKRGSADGQFYFPSDVFIDAAGNIYVADNGNNRIQMLDSNGIFLYKWGSNGSAPGQFQNPAGVAVDASGNVFVVEQNNHRVQKFSPATIVLDDGQSHTWEGLRPGTYNALERLLPDGWSLDDISCNGGSPVESGDGVTLTLAPGDDVACTFLNDGPEASLFITKAVEGNGAPADWSFAFTGDLGSFNLTDENPTSTNNLVTPGVVVVSETNPTGYATTYACDSGDSGSSGNLSLTLADEEVVNCTVTNAICQPGSYDTAAGWSCAPASPGYYVNTTGASSQIACPAGMTSPPGSDSIDDCAAIPTASLTITKETNPDGGTGFPFTLLGLDIWGSKGATGGQFYDPRGVATNGPAVYVADNQYNRIQKFDSDGTFLLAWGRDVVVGGGTGFEICTPTDTCKAGTTGGGQGEFYGPYGVAVDASGNVYVADSNNFRIQKFDAGGNFLLAWGWDVVAGGGTGFEICTPADTCKAGEYGSGDGQFSSVLGVEVDGTAVYVADTFNQRVQKFDSSGNYVTKWGGSGTGNGEFYYPVDLATNGTGHVYVLDLDLERVQKFDTSGTYLDQWGSQGSGEGEFEVPSAIAVDGAGNVYVVEAGNNRVQKFDGDGVYLAQWGSYGSGEGQFDTPFGLAADAAGTLYISEVTNYRVQKLIAGGSVTLDDDESHTFTSLIPGTYRISEQNPAGWVLDDVNCAPAQVTRNGNTVSLTLAADDDITCTFTNAPPPTVTINQAPAQDDPTGSSPILFRVVFSKPVSGFETGDVTLSGTAGATTASVTEIAPNDGTTYRVAVSGMSAGGTVIAAIEAGVAQDTSGNGNEASTSTDNEVTFNYVAPQLTIAKETNPDGGTNFPFSVLGVKSWGSYGFGGGEFYNPYGVAADGAGNVYVTDYNNHRVQKFNSAGVYLTQWGGPGSGDGQFFYPTGVAVDGAGNVYVADYFNHRIQKFDGDGNYLGQWGEYGSGDGQFSYPTGMAVDGDGNVYVSDSGNNRIQKFDSDGVYLDQWGESGSGDGQFQPPTGVAVDGDGNVYVADTNNNRIQKFDSGGGYLDQWGESGSGDGQFSFPFGVAADGDGNVYVADHYNHRIQKFNQTGVSLDDGENRTFEDLAPGTYFISEQVPAGWWLDGIECDGGGPTVSGNRVRVTLAGGDDVTCTFTNSQPASLTITKETSPAGGTDFPFTMEPGDFRYAGQWGGSGSGDGQLFYPFGVAVDGDGNFYVADTYNHRIQKFDSGGAYVTQWGVSGIGDGQFSYPFGVAVDVDGNVYVADTYNNRIQKFDSDGVYLDQWGEYGSGDGQFSSPYGVAADGDGNVYVSDADNNRIQKFDSGGVYLNQWGENGSGDGQFSYPYGVAADGAGNVYVADFNNNRIQKFDSGGVYLDQWGEYGSGDGQFQYPSGVAVDGDGNVYVVDYNNHRIQKFDGGGGYLGQWGENGSGDGQFTNPFGAAVDGDGNVYVADTTNSRIQKFNPPGATLDDGESHTFSDLAAGIYVIGEEVPAGWHLLDIDCGGATATRDGDAISVTLEAGDDVECVFTNSDTPPPTTGSIRVTKEIIGSGTGTFSICVEADCKSFSAGDGEQQTWADLAPGDYTVSEADAGPEWDEPAAQEVTVVAGQTAEVTVTNTYDPPPTTGSIRVTKEIIGSGTGTFSICVEVDCKSFSLGDGEQQTWADLAPGDYTVSEADAGPEWDEPAAQEVTVVAGQTAEVTVTNTYDPPPTTGSIRVTKEIIGSGTGTFSICVEGDCKSFSLGDGEQQTWADLAPGDYTVSEDDAGPEWDEPASQEVTVVAGQTAEVTVTNTYDPPPTTGSIRVTKEIIGSGTGTFSICVEGDCKSFSLGDGEQQTWADLAPGDYTVSEADAGPEWDEPVAQEVTVVAGQTAEVTVTNTYDPPPTTADLTIVKSVTGTGAPADWSFAFTGDLGGFSLTDEDPDKAQGGLTPGPVAVSETNPAGYTTTASCDNGDSAANGNLSVTLDAGDNVSCTFTNAICQPGHFDTATSWACAPADPGHFVSTVGASSQTACAPGFYQDAAGATECIQADPGFYAPGPAAIEQTACPSGTTSPAGSDSIDDCAPITGGPTNLFMSTIAAGTTGDGLAYGSEDILEWDGTAWSTWFDGSAAGLEPRKAKHNINAFWIPDPDGEAFIFSFTQNRRTVPGVAIKVDGMDLVRWNGSAFSFWFDGSDVYLTNKTQEKIDGLHILPGSESPIGSGCLAYLLVSTQGPGKVPNYSGGQLKFQGEDVLGFCATSLGENTTGLWHMVLDGSAEGMPRNSTDSISVSDDGGTMYLTTQGAFAVDAAAGGHSVVYAYDFATGTFSGPIFSAPAAGLLEKVDGLQMN